MTSSIDTLTTRTLVIGSGLAGIYAALRAAERGEVTIVTAASLQESSSYWAQGGVAAAMGVGDAPGIHADDTRRVGRGLCRHDAVDMLVDAAPDHIARLMELGVVFEHMDGELALGLEAGHTHRRIAHAGGGGTGRVVMEALLARVQEEPRIRVLDQVQCLGLIVEDGTCLGAHTSAGPVVAGTTVLATGGAASLYARTTNPRGSRGDGVAQAWVVGAQVADMEFVQFHPTALATGGAGDGFLLSEALRGEGAHLHNEDGERFLVDVHREAELAPRDELARAILAEIERSGASCVYLSLAHLDAGAVRRRFSALAERLDAIGLDIARDRLPVAPAAHYVVGGVLTDLGARTSIANLAACGEVASTGVHGANRLASNSLLECLVFADHAGQLDADPPRPSAALLEGAPSWAPPHGVADELWRAAGLERTHDALDPVADWLEPATHQLSAERIVAGLIATASLIRTESRGSHFRRDHPHPEPEWAGHIVLEHGTKPRLVDLETHANFRHENASLPA